MQMMGLAIVALSFLTAIYFYPLLPDRVASHWNMKGEVNGYMDREMGAFFMPVLALALFCLFIILPKIDPLKENYAAFRKEYDGMIAILISFLYYVYLLTIAYSLGYLFDMSQMLSPAFAVLFFYMGIVISKAKQNWFVGIRTPWTLASKSVWEKTHAVCGKLFKAAGVVALLGIILPDMFIASIAVLIATAVFGFVYSYALFAKEKKAKRV